MIANQCQCFMFKTIKPQKVCVNRDIQIDLLVNSFVNTNDFDEPPKDHPCRADIPVEAKMIYAKIVRSNSANKIVTGVQLLLEDKVTVVLTKKFRKPIKLISPDLTDTEIEIECCQVYGFPAKDGKQQSLLAGDISNAGICPCTVCIRPREDFGKWTERLVLLCEKNMPKRRMKDINPYAHLSRMLRRGLAVGTTKNVQIATKKEYAKARCA